MPVNSGVIDVNFDEAAADSGNLSPAAGIRPRSYCTNRELHVRMQQCMV